MHPPARLADRTGNDVHERRHVVIRHPLALLHLLHRERGSVAHGRGVVLRHHALLRECLDHGQLHLKPRFELALLGPDRAHLGTGVAGDQGFLQEPGWCLGERKPSLARTQGAVDSSAIPATEDVARRRFAAARAHPGSQEGAFKRG
jgi:hypothetical protein